MSKQPDCIATIDIVRCSLPLEHAVHIGRTTYHEREYVAVLLTTASGLEGHAVGYTRGLPLDASLAMLAPDVLGGRVSERTEVMSRVIASHINASGSLGRALSLVDIAMADALARHAGLPLWRMLGGARSHVPVMAVAGYRAMERGVDEVVDEVRRLIDAGFSAIKLHTVDVPIVSAVLRVVDDDIHIGVDASMAWTSIPEALRTCRRLDDLGLAFIEDPFTPERWRLSRDLAMSLRTPIAAGEDAVGPAALLDLTRAVGILRIDATVSGGFDAVLDVASVAASRGVEVMTHAFPDQHAHLAGARVVGMVEMIPDETGLNPVGRLLARRQVVVAGQLTLSEEPGHGAPLDRQALAEAASAWITHSADEGETQRCN